MSDAGMKCPYCGKSAQVADHVKNGVEAARKRIAKMLDAYSGTTTAHAKGDALEAKAIARLVRAADNRGAAGVDADEDAYVIERMGKLLAEIAVIVNGPEPDMTRWSYHDLPDKVRALKEAPTASPAGEAVAPRSDVVPGVMRCAKCSFQLVRTNLYVNTGTTGPGGSETEPCPNGCGPLWPVTWQQWATEGWEQAERYFEELHQLRTHPPAAEVRELAWRHPDEVPKVVPGGNAYFWVAVRRKHDGRVYSFPAQYLNAMLLSNEWSDDTERSGNRYHHGPTCEVEGSFPATGWHDAKEHGEYDCVYQPLLGDADELVAWREVANYPDTTPPAPKLNILCETRSNGIIGSTSLNVVRVNTEDDGSFTAVTDYWPPAAQAQQEA